MSCAFNLKQAIPMEKYAQPNSLFYLTEDQQQDLSSQEKVKKHFNEILENTIASVPEQ